MNTTATRTDGAFDTTRLLTTYLRDHAAGATAGEALARRCRDANADTDFAELLSDIHDEIVADRRSLLTVMGDLGVSPSRIKSALGTLAELAGRLKLNGRLTRYSPGSRVAELELLVAGVLTKRNLWRSLRGITDQVLELDPEQLDALIERATGQLDRLLEAHTRASAMAFAPGS